MKLISYYRKKLSIWLLPYTCILCGQNSTREQDLCEPCYADLPILENTCFRCGRPLTTHLSLECGTCLAHPPLFDTTHALFFYQPPITRLIMDLKFGQSLINARLLGELLAEKINTCNVSLPEAILPVPMHPNRLKERGFNQTIEIARPISKMLNIPLMLSHVKRIKHTAAQATLNAKERQQNTQFAFHITQDIPFKHIAIVDDIVTTGSTVGELCSTLKSAGVARIDVWCCARATL